LLKDLSAYVESATKHALAQKPLVPFPLQKCHPPSISTKTDDMLENKASSNGMNPVSHEHLATQYAEGLRVVADNYYMKEANQLSHDQLASLYAEKLQVVAKRYSDNVNKYHVSVKMNSIAFKGSYQS
jgi:hypothetical protein